MKSLCKVGISLSTLSCPTLFIDKFSDFIIDQRLKQNIITKGYVAPTLIQDKIIPQILAGKDVVGIANTGTGKTGAFLIPLIQKVILNKFEKNTGK